MAEVETHTDCDISIVIPLLNEEESLPELADQIEKAIAADYSYEVIFVDDGSTDTSWQVIEDLSLIAILFYLPI